MGVDLNPFVYGKGEMELAARTLVAEMRATP
jgi:hypothetical protein